jgi:hypothetical protein
MRRLTSLRKLRRLPARRRGSSPRRGRTQITTLRLERLEDRNLLSILIPSTFLDNDPNFVPGEPVQTLRDAVIQANADGGGDIIKLKAGTYNLTIPNQHGQENGSRTGDLNITAPVTIEGVYGLTIINQTQLDRVLQLVNPGLNVTLQNLIIQGGRAENDVATSAMPGATPALGGGIFNNGSNLTLVGVTVRHNAAIAGNPLPEGPLGTTVGEAGLPAQGGGIFTNGGTVTLINSAINNNMVSGGNGGKAGTTINATQISGGLGGSALGGGLYAINAATITLGQWSPAGGFDSFMGNSAVAGQGGDATWLRGGAAGPGGEADGGALYLGGSLLALGNKYELATISGNSLTGGQGGIGGTGPANYPGLGGDAQGGGIYATALATVSLTGPLVAVTTNQAVGGRGGAGGPLHGGLLGGEALGGGIAAFTTVLIMDGGSLSANQAEGGPGGAATGSHGGGPGGNAQGGGLFSLGGPLTLTSVTVANNRAVAGPGANAVATGTPGTGGMAEGGGIASFGAIATPTFTGLNLAGNVAQGGSGGAGINDSIGGIGGTAEGGALAVDAVILNGGWLTANRAIGGIGGSGGSGTVPGTGGLGGPALGGALYASSSATGVSLSGVKVTANSATGGAGGAGGKAIGSTGRGGSGNSGGGGGTGGTGQGGALYLDGSSASVTLSPMTGNLARGGSGGAGGKGSAGVGGGNGGGGGAGGMGGLAQGGALFNGGTSTTIFTASPLTANSARGGNGGAGGSGGAGSISFSPLVVGWPGPLGPGGSGDDGQGGGAYVGGGTTLDLQGSSVIGNVAAGGLKGPGHPNALTTPGAGLGGGVIINATGGGVLITSVSTKITANFPTNTATE